jgi:hypothetical protein
LKRKINCLNMLYIIYLAHNPSMHFHSLSFQDSLPFPLYLSLSFKIFMLVILIFILSFGSKLRLIIFSYQKAPNTKMGAINYLICIDQVIVFFLGVSISYKLSSLGLTVLVQYVHLRSINGLLFCFM